GNDVSAARCASKEFFAESSPAPMWKLIGRFVSRATVHNGSQCRLHSGGRPNLWGSPVKRRLRKPIPTQRNTSSTAARTSQNGREQTVMRRSGATEAHSARKSL